MQITTGNVAPDDDSMLINLKSCLSFKSVYKRAHLTQSSSTVNISVSDFTIRSMPEQNAFVYVCGYLLKKVLSVHTCEIFVKLKETGLSSSSDSYILLKNYHDCALLEPSIIFTMYIYQCENLFHNYFSENKHLAGIGQRILKILKTVKNRLNVTSFLSYTYYVFLSGFAFIMFCVLKIELTVIKKNLIKN